MPSSAAPRFNPRPSRKRGATGRHPRRRHLPHRFNPRPSRKRGATIGLPDDDVVDSVSILAPLARGALPSMGYTVQTLKSFQSSPLSQEGRYGRIDSEGARSRRVSILAPLARGALPTETPCQHASRTCFNPRPSRKRGATYRGQRRLSRLGSFNPRPSRKRGATRISPRWGFWPGVSILAPLARGALPTTSGYRQSSQIVSILAPLARGALRTLSPPCRRRSHVSILAPLARGALLGRAV